MQPDFCIHLFRRIGEYISLFVYFDLIWIFVYMLDYIKNLAGHTIGIF